MLLAPLYKFLKNQIIKKASSYFKKIKGNTKVIAITGSYGKTTVKNFIEQLVKSSYKTQMIPGNINSTIGIANWILTDFKKETEILIVEMDSYFPKRISKSTKLVNPYISIITNIGDQHLERYKTRQNLAKSLFEIFESSPEESFRITNEETFNYLKGNNFDTKNIITIKEKTENTFMSVSNNQNLQYALSVTKILKIPQEYTEYISKKLTVPDRRQLHAKMFNFEVIDDSYNISLNTASVGINEAFVLSKKSNKKLLIITAGIPELGPLQLDGNEKLGNLLDQKADEIFILKSIYHKEIFSGITNKEKVSLFINFNEAIQSLQKNYKTDEWFVLIQPELTDLYY